MRKLAAAAVAVGIITASCSGHGANMTPPVANSQSARNGSHGTRTLTTAAAPAGWAATGTLALQLANATDLGELAATQSVTIRLGLQMRSESQLQSAVASGQRFDKSAFMSTYAPTSNQVSQVTSYLQSQGFTNIQAEPNNLLISATGTAAQVQQAFDTKLESFSQNGLTVFANTSPAYVPQALGGIVLAILGLNNAQAMKATPHKGGPGPKPTPVPTSSPTPAPSPTPTVAPASPCSLYGLEILGFPTGPVQQPTTAAGCLRTYLPADYWRAYDALNAPAASSVSVAIMAEGNVQQSISDLRVNEQADGLVQAPVVVKQVGVASTDTSGDDEWTLDMTASSGMARAVKTIYLYDAPSLTDSDIALMYSHWVTDNLAPIGNSSFGGCEAFPFLDGSMVIDDELFLEGAAQGQTMFASSGDTGSFCPVAAGANGVPAGAPLVNYPAASPYVVAVGGTTMVTMSDGSYQGEAAWYAGGGGLSQFEYSPYWEAEAQPVSQNGESYRGVPDIAMDGDLQTGMDLYLSDAGGWTIIGGTSLSSPLAAGSYARLEQSHGGSLGFAAPLLYKNFSTHTAGAQQTGPPPWQPDGGFHDILAGGNGTYTALPGYDYTTGLGSIDVSLLNTQI
jgi:pseudomonalisin